MNHTNTPEQASLNDPSALLPAEFISEAALCKILATTKRALRQRPAAARPPAINLSCRVRVYDPREVAAWVASLPRTR